MKRLTTTLSAIFVAFGTLLTTAQAEIKVASVNMVELNIMYYKRAEVQESLRKQEEAVKAEIKQRQEKVIALNEEAKKLNDQADPTLSEAAMKTLREKAAAIKNEFEAAQEELKTFVQRREVALREIVRREQLLLAQALQNAVNEAAAEGGYDIVIDASALSAASGSRAFPFVKPELDITETVLKRLNADAPADFDPKAELERVRAGVVAPASAE